MVGSADGEPRRGDVVAAVLGDLSSHFGDPARRTANVVTQSDRSHVDELFNGDEIAINEVAGMRCAGPKMCSA